MTPTAGAVLLCTGNAHKLSELRAMVGAGVQVLTPAEVGVRLDAVEESAADFEGNALLKARYGHGAWRGLTVADDSGLCVDALEGRPGVRTARLAQDMGTGKGDADNNRTLLQLLREVPVGKRAAHYVCAVAVVTPGGEARTFRGEWHGAVALEPRGHGGFGYDPLFLDPDGQSAAELSNEQKHARSHRGQAMAAALPFIRQQLELRAGSAP